jgi:hypothetical protein
MVKKKIRSIVSAADGAGRMIEVPDRRFEGGDWPIQFELVDEKADTWLLYFSAECQRRGWQCPSIVQLDGKENSASITVNTGAGEPQLSVVWERKRNGPLRVKARSTGTPEFPLDQANELFERVNETCRAGAVKEFYRVGLLCYDRLAWRGELWLSDKLRLGPPSQQDEQCALASRNIIVNARVTAIDWLHANSIFTNALRELSVFLTVIMGTHVQAAPNSRRAWTFILDPDSPGGVHCDIRNIGYYERQLPTEMPMPGQGPSVPLRAIQRPDFTMGSVGPEDTEQELPRDVLELWQAFEALSPDLRRQFVQAGTLWQLALSLGHDYETARFSYMVAACEALKPPGREFDACNIYDVLTALFGKETAHSLRQKFQPQDVRSAHFHTGEFRGSEFSKHPTMSTFFDPTFHDATGELYKISQAAIIEWLRRGGTTGMSPPIKRRRPWRRLVRQNALPVTGGVAVGVGLGWLLARAFVR